MANNESDVDTIARSPYISGGSKVMTVSGIPPLDETGKIITKKATINGSECVICFPYENFSEYEVENMDIDLEL